MEETYLHYMNKYGRNKVHLTEVAQKVSYLNLRCQSSSLFHPRLDSCASGFSYLNVGPMSFQHRSCVILNACETSHLLFQKISNLLQIQCHMLALCRCLTWLRVPKYSKVAQDTYKHSLNTLNTFDTKT